MNVDIAAVAVVVGQRQLSVANRRMALADVNLARNASGVEGSSISFPTFLRAAMICA